LNWSGLVPDFFSTQGCCAKAIHTQITPIAAQKFGAIHKNMLLYEYLPVELAQPLAGYFFAAMARGIALESAAIPSHKAPNNRSCG
jgi:hypothetical protein